jgi:hypothetical protein
LVSGWQPAGAAEEAGGEATAAGVVGEGVVGAGADGVGVCADCVGACDVAGAVGCVSAGWLGCAAAAAFVAWWLGVPGAVAESVVVRPAFVPLPGDEGDRPEFAAAMMIARAMKARNPVSALCRAGQDLPRGGCGR